MTAFQKFADLPIHTADSSAPPPPQVGGSRPALPPLTEQAAQLQQQGKLEEAEALCQQSLAQFPGDANTLYLMGKITRQMRRLEESAQWMLRAIQRDPNISEWHRDLGECLAIQGRVPEATMAQRRAVELRPNWCEGWFLLGVLLDTLGKAPDAERSFRRALEIQPAFVPALLRLAFLMDKAGRRTESEELLRRCLSLMPRSAEAHNNLGALLEKMGRVGEALECYRRALGLKTDYPQARNNLAHALEYAGRLPEALAEAQLAVQQAPEFGGAYNTLGSILYHLERFSEAAEALQTSIRLDPNNAEPLNNLGRVQRELGDAAGAETSLRRAIGMRPNHVSSHFNLANLLLANERFAEGWEHFEWRTLAPEFRRFWNNAKPDSVLAGAAAGAIEDAIMNGKTVLLEAEQGLGDTMQFLRFVPILRRRGLRLAVAVQPALFRLVQQSFQFAQVPIVTESHPRPKCDLHLPMMSLGRQLRVDLNSIPGNVPYLASDPADAERWRWRLAEEGQGFRVGLAWGGSQQHKGDQQRSCPLAQFAPLAAVAGVTWYSLQKGPPAAQLAQPPAGMTIHDRTADLRDLSDTAAMMSNLDLVVCVDTAVAHLAGALGKPVFMLLPPIADWRWMQARTDSPWYPSMRLFRAKALHQWSEPMAQLAEAVQEMRRHY